MRFLRNLLKDAFFLTHAADLGSRASILSYHNIGTDGAFFTVTPRALERQLAYIKDADLHVVSLSELVTRLNAGKDISRQVALTFNDGYKSFYTTLFPLLKEYEIPATICLAAELLDTSIQTSDGHTFQTLALDEVREMRDSGLVEFIPRAAHRQSLGDLVFERAVEHVEAARQNIEALTQTSAPLFACAKSELTERLAEYMRSHDWLGAVSNYEGLVHPHTNPFFLRRNSVNRYTTFTQFKGKLSGAIEEYIETRGR